MSSLLLEFKRIYGLEIQSVMLVFSTGFANYCPSNPLNFVFQLRSRRRLIMQQSPFFSVSRTKEEGGLPKNPVLRIHITSVRIRSLFLVMRICNHPKTMWIGIQLHKTMWIHADPDSASQNNVDPYPASQNDVDPDPYSPTMDPAS
jgi:hypothetical protein